MGFTHIDLIGLNKHEMHDAPIVRTGTELKTLAEISQASQRSISIAGMRHSQGGHTALDGGSMVFTEAMEQRITVDKTNMTVTVNAGATWSDLHFHLGPLGLAPLVHQSSPHFSIGGSLSVDCHGREVHEGALSNTVESITVLTNKDNKLEETIASRTDKPDLFFGALGGYGACGVILNATLRITKNISMYKFGYYLKENTENPEKEYEKLVTFLNTASVGKRNPNDGTELYMFYAWMNVSQDTQSYLTHSMVYEYVKVDIPNQGMLIKWFKNEGWASTEAMRAAWSAGRRDAELRGKLFEIIAEKTIQNPNGDNYLINFLREEISFTSTKGDADDVDLLQEFFIPLPNIKKFLHQLKTTLLPLGNPNIEVLSCTLRIIQAPREGEGKPFLSYAYSGTNFPLNIPIVSVALEIKVKKMTTGTDTTYPNTKVDNQAIVVIKDIIKVALGLEGRYYLPYYQTAEPEQFIAAYPNHTDWKAAADKWNPIAPGVGGKRAFNNEFLKAYLK